MKKANKKNRGIRHGEVILIPVEKMIGKVTKETKKFIVAHSETGHHHVIESEVIMSVDEVNMYIELFKDSNIVHKKGFDAHRTLPLEKGVYKRYEMIEKDLISKVIRRVKD